MISMMQEFGWRNGVVTASKPKVSVRTFKIRYTARDNTFPKEAKISRVRFDKTYMHVTLTESGSSPFH